MVKVEQNRLKAPKAELDAEMRIKKGLEAFEAENQDLISQLYEANLRLEALETQDQPHVPPTQKAENERLKRIEDQLTQVATQTFTSQDFDWSKWSAEPLGGTPKPSFAAADEDTASH